MNEVVVVDFNGLERVQRKTRRPIVRPLARSLQVGPERRNGRPPFTRPQRRHPSGGPLPVQLRPATTFCCWRCSVGPGTRQAVAAAVA